MKWYIDMTMHLTKNTKYTIRSCDGDNLIADISSGSDAVRIVDMHNATIDSLNTINPMKKYVCWFMFENHTFHECVGNLFEIKGMLSVLFKVDKEGGWGKLRLLESKAENYIVGAFQRNMEMFPSLDGVYE